MDDPSLLKVTFATKTASMEFTLACLRLPFREINDDGKMSGIKSLEMDFFVDEEWGLMK